MQIILTSDPGKRLQNILFFPLRYLCGFAALRENYLCLLLVMSKSMETKFLESKHSE